MLDLDLDLLVVDLDIAANDVDDIPVHLRKIVGLSRIRPFVGQENLQPFARRFRARLRAEAKQTSE
jgi:hypothetical protein